MLPITFEARVKGSGRISTGWAASVGPTLVMEVASFIFAPSRVPLQHRHWAAACRLWICKATAVWRRISGLHPLSRRLARGGAQDWLVGDDNDVLVVAHAVECPILSLVGV